ncbi:orexin receptor type 2-like [Octopus vulgaris]|uniref:Orexin receptor type 2-like n=2 Tax=Octopus TaxID=6643 RepID=A0AA36BL98_OCTVU|nr:neurotensin receptor type 1 [Octopus sinensis]XP_029645884.1 neurotensin receptor type 1 [Octopus sinensis]CAI9736338.1 orexin receptor type 2-like [Octopus vulgaris]
MHTMKMAVNISINSSANILQVLNDEKADTYLPVIFYVGISMLFGAIGNSAVSYIYYCKLEKTATNLFVAVLSACDLLSCLISMPVEIVGLRFPLTFHSDIACRLIRFIVAVGTITSALIIFVISVDRYLRVCRPLGRHFSRRSAKVASAVLVFSSILLATPAFLVFGKQRVPTRISGIIGEECSIAEGLKDTIYPLAYYCSLLVTCFAVFVVLMTLYFLIGIYVWRHKKKNQGRIQKVVFTHPSNDRMSAAISSSSDNVEDDLKLHKQSRQKITRPMSSPVDHRQSNSVRVSRTTVIMFLITLLWIVSYLPHLVMVTCEIVVEDFRTSLGTTGDVLYNLSFRSYFFNNAINPFIYGIFNLRFRKELFILLDNIFGACCCKNNP